MDKKATPNKGEQTAFERFEQMTKHVVAVPKSEADKREKAWQKQRKKSR